MFLMIRVNNLTISDHITDILTDKHAFGQVFVRNYVISHVLFVDEFERTEWLGFVLLVNFLLGFTHEHQTEIEALFVVIIQCAIYWFQIGRVRHLFHEDCV